MVGALLIKNRVLFLERDISNENTQRNDSEVDYVVNDLVDEEIMKWLIATEPILSTSSSSSGSDSDIEEKRSRKIIKRNKIENFVENVIPTYSNGIFKEHFRISKVPAYNLIEKFRTSQCQPSTTNNLGLSAEKSILLCLWYLTNTESFRQISDRFNISMSSAYRVLCRTVEFICSLREEFIKWPNVQERQQIAREFGKKHGFKEAIGCIDGSHIRINRPQKDEEVYVNRKGYHSLLLQGVVDDKKCFIDVFCGEPGSIHDARLLRKSSLYKKEQENREFFGKYYLLGDSAYPSLEWLIPPFRDDGNLSEDKKTFNYNLSSTRIVVEHAFGLLKNKFRRLRHFENLNIKLIVKCIMAACILHNMCLKANDSFQAIADVENGEPREELVLEAINRNSAKSSRQESIFL